MGRKPRIDIADTFHHCMNRSNARLQINFNEQDYILFLKTLEEAQIIFSLDILAFCIMNNHFHLVIYIKKDGEMGQFMRWLTFTFTQRWHKKYNTVGNGHLFQGRYKSVFIQNQNQLATVIRYVERNPLTANLVKNILDWKYSSLYQIYKRTKFPYKIKLSNNFFERKEGYLGEVAEPLTNKELESAKYYE